MSKETGYAEAMISIHPPRGGRDQDCQAIVKNHRKFQSTLPVGGGTIALKDVGSHP